MELEAAQPRVSYCEGAAFGTKRNLTKHLDMVHLLQGPLYGYATQHKYAYV